MGESSLSFTLFSSCAECARARGRSETDFFLRSSTRLSLFSAGNTQIFSPLDGTIVNPVIQEEIFIEACDVFFGSLPKVSTAGALTVGNELGLNDERTLWCLERRRPELILVGGADGGEVKAVKIGRGKLACKATKQGKLSNLSGSALLSTRSQFR